jgi:hypothetical protein
MNWIFPRRKQIDCSRFRNQRSFGSSIIQYHSPYRNSTQKLAPEILQPGMRAWRSSRLITRSLQTTRKPSATVQRSRLRGFRSSNTSNERPSLLLQPDEGSTVRNTGTGLDKELKPPPRNPFCFVCGRVMRTSRLTFFTITPPRLQSTRSCLNSSRSLLLHLAFSLVVSISPHARQELSLLALLTP